MEFGLGANNAPFSVYIANQPNYADYSDLASIKPLQCGDIAGISNNCGNGWRKVFNVYAKLVFALDSDDKQWIGQSQSWQEYRDNILLTSNSGTSLIFSTPQWSQLAAGEAPRMHLVMGKGYGQKILQEEALHWLDDHFAVIQDKQCIVCPYFDYRQLTNQKIIQLVSLIRQLDIFTQR